MPRPLATSEDDYYTAPSPAQRDGGCQGRTDPVKVASTAPEDTVKVAEIAAPKLSRSCS